jgi:predicted PurR-regulated permease PerM
MPHYTKPYVMISFNMNSAIKLLLFFFLIFAGLYFAKPVLAPFSVAALLAMLFLPLSNKLEQKGVSRGLSAFLCVFLLLLAIAGVVSLIFTQVAGIAEDAPKLKENIGNAVSKLKEQISKAVSISPAQQQEMIKQQQSGGGGKAGAVVSSVFGAMSGLLVDTILGLVYIFLLLYLRKHLKNFMLRLVAPDQKSNAGKIINEAAGVATKYLTGLAMMIGMLWIMYGIGFSIVGVRNAIFFAILCGLLEIVPFVGNLTGTGRRDGDRHSYYVWVGSVYPDLYPGTAGSWVGSKDQSTFYDLGNCDR